LHFTLVGQHQIRYRSTKQIFIQLYEIMTEPINEIL